VNNNVRTVKKPRFKIAYLAKSTYLHLCMG
jgi:hypothetical protein